MVSKKNVVAGPQPLADEDLSPVVGGTLVPVKRDTKRTNRHSRHSRKSHCGRDSRGGIVIVPL